MVIDVSGNSLKLFATDSYLTFPLQYWQADPCQPSWQTQVPLEQSPLTQESRLHVASSPVIALVAFLKTVKKVTSHNTHETLSNLSWSVPFRLYFDLNRNKNICTASAILEVAHDSKSMADEATARGLALAGEVEWRHRDTTCCTQRTERPTGLR